MTTSSSGKDAGIASWLSKSQEVVSSEQCKIANSVKTFSPATYVEAQVDAAQNPEGGPIQYSKRMHPQSYLDFAAKHDNAKLAEKEGLTAAEVRDAIADAAHYVSSRNCAPVIGVFEGFEKARLSNGVYSNHKQYAAAVNRRANSHFRACGITKPDLSRSSVPCMLREAANRGSARCRKHAYCSLMKMEAAVKAAFEAEQEVKPADAATGRAGA